MRLERVAQRGLQLAVELHDMDVRDPGREVLAQHPEAAADLEHDVLRAQVRGARDDVEQVRVDEEVLSELPVRPHPEGGHAAQAGLDREPAHHPKSRALFACTASSTAS
jgi:hypothetical protein